MKDETQDEEQARIMRFDPMMKRTLKWALISAFIAILFAVIALAILEAVYLIGGQ